MQKQNLIKPDIEVVSVEPKMIDKVWPLCEFMVVEALKYSGGFALMVTRISELPNFKQLEAIICTGRKRHLWEDMLVSTVSKFGKLNNCKKLSFWCRPGWAKISKKWGWKVKHIQMEKDL